MANRFVLNETSYHGAGAIAEIATEAVGRGFAKALVCSDPDLIKFGVTKKVTDVLDGAGLAYEIYSNIKPNPTIENVQQGVAAFKAAGGSRLRCHRRSRVQRIYIWSTAGLQERQRTCSREKEGQASKRDRGDVLRS